MYQSILSKMTVNILKNFCSFVCVVSVIVNAYPSSKLPSGFIKCSISDPKFDECLKGDLEKAIPHLVKGVPSLNLMKVDPMRISKIEINQGTGPVSINLKIMDLDIMNIKFLQLNTIHYDKKNDNLFFDLNLPKPVQLEGDYEISGKILILPIVGKGRCKLSLEVSKVVGYVKLKKIVKNGDKYFHIDNLSWKMTPTNLNVKFDNLFNGNKALGDNMNSFINENWRDVFAELQPAIEDVFAISFTEMGGQFLSRIPSKDIISD